MVIAPARTGRDNNNKIAVIRTDQENRVDLSKLIPLTRRLLIEEIKLTAPRIEEIPAKCKEKIDKSTDLPEWEIVEDNGGYTVHPVPVPLSTNLLIINRVNDGGRNQKLILFIRGNAISGADNINGINQFPNPPIMIGITIKKIIIKAWAVTITLKIWSFPINAPGHPSSIRIRILNDVPIIPDHTPKIKYRVPMSLWLVEYIHFCYWLIKLMIKKKYFL